MLYRILLILTLAYTVVACRSCFPPQAPVQVEAHTSSFQPEVLRAAVGGLMAAVPLNGPLEVRVLVIEDTYLGATYRDGGGYIILIEARQSMMEILGTLVHEYAHAMVYDAALEDPHGPLWGVAYARAYREALRAVQAYNAQ